MHKVGSLTTLKAGQALSADIDGARVAVFLIDGKVVATTGKCPHAGGPLSAGTLCGAVLSCPWHGWSFDLTTGQCEEDPQIVLPLYSVHIEGDEVLVTLC
jgi:nitrite reductase (NADH) small subunit